MKTLILNIFCLLIFSEKNNKLQTHKQKTVFGALQTPTFFQHDSRV